MLADRTKLTSVYQHLVDGYSERLRDEWKVKVEESNTEAKAVQVKEEPEDDYTLESLSIQLSNTNKNPEVRYIGK